MRSKSQYVRTLLWLALLGGSLIVAAAEPAADDPPARPENQARPLPDDTFTPSEEVSEDFPVPFPVDI